MNDKQRAALLQASRTVACVSPAAAKMFELIANSPCVSPPHRIRIRRDLLPPDRGQELGVVVTVER